MAPPFGLACGKTRTGRRKAPERAQIELRGKKARLERSVRSPSGRIRVVARSGKPGVDMSGSKSAATGRRAAYRFISMPSAAARTRG